MSKLPDQVSPVLFTAKPRGMRENSIQDFDEGWNIPLPQEFKRDIFKRTRYGKWVRVRAK